MHFKDNLYLSNSNAYMYASKNTNANTKNCSFQNDPTFLQEAYSGLGMYFPFFDCEQSPNIAISTPNNYATISDYASTPDYGSKSDYASTFAYELTPDYVSTPGYISPSGYVSTPDSVSVVHDSQQYLSCPVGTIPVDYFNHMLHAERDNSLISYGVSDIDVYSKEYKFQDVTAYAKLNNFSTDIFKNENIDQKVYSVSSSKKPDTFVPKSPALSTSSIVSQLSTALNRNSGNNDSESIKKHACNYCDRKFSRKYDARRHIRIHTGDKPYTCPCCSKGFARSDALRRHIHKEPICLAHSKEHLIVKLTKISKN